MKQAAQIVPFEGQTKLQTVQGQAQGYVGHDPMSILEQYVRAEQGSDQWGIAIRKILPLGSDFHTTAIGLAQRFAAGELETKAGIYEAAVHRLEDKGLQTLAVAAYITTRGPQDDHTTGDWEAVLAQDPTLAGDYHDAQLQGYATRVMNDPNAQAFERLAASLIGLRSYDAGNTTAVEQGIATALEQDVAVKGFVLAAIEAYTNAGETEKARVALNGTMHYAARLDASETQTFVEELKGVTNPELMVNSLSGLLHVYSRRDI